MASVERTAENEQKVYRISPQGLRFPQRIPTISLWHWHAHSYWPRKNSATRNLCAEVQIRIVFESRPRDLMLGTLQRPLDFGIRNSCFAPVALP